MKVTSSKDKTEFAELSKLLSKARQSDARNLNMRGIEKAVEKGASIKSAKKKLH